MLFKLKSIVTLIYIMQLEHVGCIDSKITTYPMPVLAYCLISKVGNSKNANKWRVQGQMAICNWTQVHFHYLKNHVSIIILQNLLT
jgi:hypothetical protein